MDETDGRGNPNRKRGEGSPPPNWHDKQSGVLIYVYVDRMITIAGLVASASP